MTIGDIFSNKQIEGIEDHLTTYKSEVDWELDDYQKQRLKELGLQDDGDCGIDIISRI